MIDPPFLPSILGSFSMHKQLEIGPNEPQKSPGMISFNEVTCSFPRVRAMRACASIAFVIHACAPGARALRWEFFGPHGCVHPCVPLPAILIHVCVWSARARQC